MTKTSRDRVEQALAAIADSRGEGGRACLSVYAEAARAAADQATLRAKAGDRKGPLDGAIITVKDLFDVAGEVTRAGSRALLKRGNPAAADAPVVRRLREAGAVIIGKTNMTEFAYSGIGANPHFGTPGNPADRARVPGGSSSGAAVAVGDGFCDIAIGTDTGGSTRIPASFCGLVGFKPTARRVPREGAFPLSFTFDSIGPIASSVADGALADAILAGETPEPVRPADLASLRFGVLQGRPLEGLDRIVAPAFERALAKLGPATCSDVSIGALDEMATINARGGVVPAEAYAIHRGLLATAASEIDPNVRERLQRAAGISAADYILNLRDRGAAVAHMDSIFDAYDALVLPTTPIAAPLQSEVATAEDFTNRNMLALRNPSIANFLDLCAVSLPIRLSNSLPCGLMLFGRHGDDRRLLAIAAAIEAKVAG